MFFSKSKSNTYRWKYLRDVNSYNQLLEDSTQKPLVIFKHSTRCPISSMALDRFMDSVSDISEISNLVMIDVIDDRSTSLYAADELGVMHQSPQIIVIHNRKAIYDNSHNGIQGKTVLEILQKLQND